MTKEKQLIAIAELDGWKHIKAGKDSFGVPYEDCVNREHETILVSKLPPYLTSRDAIIPVIEKLNKYKQVRVGVELELIVARDFKCCTALLTTIDLVTATPAQLSEALLRAVGKWEE